MTPIDIFILFDEDDSGLISFEEFRKMLPMLDIDIPPAKAFRYYRICDTVNKYIYYNTKFVFLFINFIINH